MVITSYFYTQKETFDLLQGALNWDEETAYSVYSHPASLVNISIYVHDSWPEFESVNCEDNLIDQELNSVLCLS